MKKYIYCITMLMTMGSLCSAQQIKKKYVAEENNKSWTIDNSIETRYFETVGKNETLAVPSPNGKYFYFSSRRGDVKTDNNIYELEVFSSNDILSALDNKEAIKNTSHLMPLTKKFFLYNDIYGWSNDNKSILIEETTKDTSKLCIFNILTGTVKTIHSVKKINNYQQESQSHEFISYNEDVSTILLRTSTCFYDELSLYNEHPELTVTDNNYINLLVTDGYRGKLKNVYHLYHKGKVVELPKIAQSAYYKRIWMSPSGKNIMMIQQRKDYPSFTIMNCDNISDAGQVIKASAGINTPVGSKLDNLTDVLWTTDDKYAILVNAALRVKENVKKQDTMAYIIAVDLKNGINQVLEPLITNDGTVSKVSWNEQSDELIITFTDDKSKSSKTIGYKRQGEEWIKDPSPKVNDLNKHKDPELPDGLKIMVRQNEITPPRVIATNGKAEIYLTESDTALKNVYIAPSKAIQWKMPDGTLFTGGLTLPRGYENLKPLPLIIQNYGFEPDKFSPDGTVSSGYATQLLVANGFAVVQMDISVEDLLKKYGSPGYYKYMSEEGPDYVAKIDAVVGMLADSGLIDLNRVGVIGFSRGGFENLYAITHPGKIKLAAAMCLDAYIGGFDDYLRASKPEHYYLNYKGPFWEHKEEWLKEVPIFNIDKVVTPLLYSMHGYKTTINNRLVMSQLSNLKGAFQINQKPLELLLYPRAGHSLFFPRDRYGALAATIDWMNFWLMGKEDNDPTKAEKYMRWREFRKMQDAVLKEKAAEKN